MTYQLKKNDGTDLMLRVGNIARVEVRAEDLGFLFAVCRAEELEIIIGAEIDCLLKHLGVGEPLYSNTNRSRQD